MPKLDSLKEIINYRVVFIFTIFVLVSLICISLISTNILATQGFAVSESEIMTLKLEKENHQLSVKIEEATKLGSLEEQAKKDGFIRSKSIVFAPTPPTFASR